MLYKKYSHLKEQLLKDIYEIQEKRDVLPRTRILPDTNSLIALRTDIENDQIRVTFATSSFDLFVASVVCNALALITHGFFAINHPGLWVFLLAYEALPIIGGVAAMYRTFYLLITLSIPRIFRDLLCNQTLTEKTKRVVLHLLTGVSTNIDFGWLLIPFIRNSNNLSMSRILLWRMANKMERKLPHFRRI